MEATKQILERYIPKDTKCTIWNTTQVTPTLKIGIVPARWNKTQRDYVGNAGAIGVTGAVGYTGCCGSSGEIGPIGSCLSREQQAEMERLFKEAKERARVEAERQRIAREEYERNYTPAVQLTLHFSYPNYSEANKLEYETILSTLQSFAKDRDLKVVGNFNTVDDEILKSEFTTISQYLIQRKQEQEKEIEHHIQKLKSLGVEIEDYSSPDSIPPLPDTAYNKIIKSCNYSVTIYSNADTAFYMYLKQEFPGLQF